MNSNEIEILEKLPIQLKNVIMKNIIVGIALLLIISCSNDDNKLTEINNDGTGGVSCKINGHILKPRVLALGLQSTYFKIRHNGETTFFVVGFLNIDPVSERYRSVRIQVYDVEYQNPITFEKLSLLGNVYQLGDYGNPSDNGQFKTYGKYEDDEKLFSTTEIINGEITITHHDIKNFVISGTFWFDAINENGEIIEIREGRFDEVLSGL